MGVAYNGIGGIGIKVTEDMKSKFIKNGLVKEDEIEEDGWSEAFYNSSEFITKTAGNGCYTGEEDILYLIVVGETLCEIIKNESLFREKLKKYGIEIQKEDLKVIEDLHVW